MIVKLFIFITLYAACILAAPYGVPDFSQDPLPQSQQLQYSPPPQVQPQPQQQQYAQPLAPQNSDNQQQYTQSPQLQEQVPTPPLPQPQ